MSSAEHEALFNSTFDKSCRHPSQCKKKKEIQNEKKRYPTWNSLLLCLYCVLSTLGIECIAISLPASWGKTAAPSSTDPLESDSITRSNPAVGKLHERTRRKYITLLVTTEPFEKKTTGQSRTTCAEEIRTLVGKKKKKKYLAACFCPSPSHLQRSPRDDESQNISAHRKITQWI